MTNKRNKAKYKFFQHTECEFFPCHKISNPKKFNCLFCYCPLYMLKDKCGGNFRYIENGMKDCSKCTIPHREDGYEYIMSKLIDVMRMANEKE